VEELKGAVLVDSGEKQIDTEKMIPHSS